MTKTEMTKLVRSMGANENTITAMENAYEMGVEAEREACALMVEREWSSNQEKALCDELAAYIRVRGNT